MMKACCIVCAVLSFATGAGAVIVAGGDGTQNTNAPTGGQGWDYVGRITSANGAPSSVTYLDNNWFITAYHVKSLDNPTGVLLGGSSYSIDPNQWVRLKNTDNSDADLILFRVNETVAGLLETSVRTTSVSDGTALTMIGNGLNRGGEYNIGNPSSIDGYYYGSGTTKRWGTNTKEQDEGVFVGVGYGSTHAFSTDFDDLAGEAQGVTYDSGGGVFVENGDQWDLAGIMIAAESGTDGTDRFTAFGNKTYVADLSFYADQIQETTAIPEPAVIVFVSIFGFGLLFAKRLVT